MNAENYRRTAESWNAVYVAGTTPWDTGVPDPVIVQAFEQRRVRSCRVLDVGCGTGNEALFMAGEGAAVVGVDVSIEAIAKARRKAEERGVGRCAFRVAEASALEDIEGTFDIVLDKACLHFIPRDRWPRYMAQIGRVLDPSGEYWLIAASDLDIVTSGPHKFSPDEIRRVFAPRFEVLEIRACVLRSHELRPAVYFCRMKKSALK